MCSVRGIWSDEANLEAEEIMNRKMTALNVTGSNSRDVAKEVFNSYYELTKILPGGKEISPMYTSDYLSLAPDNFTRSKIAKMFADTTDISVSNNSSRRKALHNTWDTINIPANFFYDGHGSTKLTIGRFLLNQFVLNGAGIITATGIVDYLVDKSGLGKLDDLIGRLYLEDKINRVQFNSYIDRRDTLGYWLNGMLAHSISIKMAKPLKEIEAMKKKLFSQYEKEIADGNIDVMNKIEKELVEYAREILKDDPGMDLYLSGDLDFSNNYKNNSIVKGPVMNKVTGEFDFIKTSFMNGIDVKDLPIHANSILAGQYPASIATQNAGYMGKKLLSLLQTSEVDEPGTDCGTKQLIPIEVNDKSKNDLVYSYFSEGGQLKLLTPENVSSYVGKTLMFRSPMSCITSKICNKCAGELFYKLDVKNIGLMSVNLSHAMLNISLKSKHNSTVNLYKIDPDNIIESI